MNKAVLKKIVLLAVIIAVIAIFRLFDLGQYLTLSYVKESQAGFMALYEEHKIVVISLYMAIYIVVTALSLPGATVLTLAGGGIFGLLAGFVIVSFASTTGAAIACVVSRYLLSGWVQNKFSDKLRAINEGVEKEGAFYLFTMRLIPAFPFFVINLVMGLTKMPIFTFYWVSQLGMIPGTIVYVNAGKELSKIESLSGILSPGLIISFALLGLFPIVTKKLMALYKRRFHGNYD